MMRGFCRVANRISLLQQVKRWEYPIERPQDQCDERQQRNQEAPERTTRRPRLFKSFSSGSFRRSFPGFVVTSFLYDADLSIILQVRLCYLIKRLHPLLSELTHQLVPGN
jgi:hypothetical protein